MARRTSVIIGGSVAALALMLSACGNGDEVDDTNPSLPAEFTITTRGPLPDYSDDEIATACAALEPILEVKAASDAAGAGLSDAFDDPEILADPARVEELYTSLDEVMVIAETSLTFYDTAARELPDALAAEIEILRDGTAALLPPVREVLDARPPGDELIVQMQEAATDPEVATLANEAGVAALRLDEFTEPNCGFLVSDAG